MALAFVPAAHAVEWRFEPTLSASATYTDNVNQSENNKQDALILSATPGFTLRSEGSRRVKAVLQYGLTGVARFADEQSDNFYHNLNAIGKAELVENFLFVDATANISQQLISLLGSPADATINNSNRATVGTYSLSPYIQKRFGSFASALVRYTNSGAIFQDNAASNATSNALTASLASGPRFGDLSWGLNYSIRKTQNRHAADTTLESASATAGYALTPKFRVFGTVGEDRNDFLSSTGTSGAFYSAGFGWSPTRRTSIEASAGERYFGRTFSLAGSHRTRLTRWNIRYSEDVSDISQQFLEASSRTYWQCPLNAMQNIYVPVTDPAQPPDPSCQSLTAGQIIVMNHLTGLQASQVGLTDIALANGIFIIKSLTAGVSWDIRRLGFGLSMQDTQRLYQLLGDAQDRVQGVTGSVSYQLSHDTTANSSLSLTRNSVDALVAGGGLAREDDILSLSVGVNRRFSDKLNGALTFRHTERDSNLANSNFKENSVTATANMRF